MADKSMSAQTGIGVDVFAAWPFSRPHHLRPVEAGTNNLSYVVETYFLRIYQNRTDPVRIQCEHVLLQLQQQYCARRLCGDMLAALRHIGMDRAVSPHATYGDLARVHALVQDPLTVLVDAPEVEIRYVVPLTGTPRRRMGYTYR